MEEAHSIPVDDTFGHRQIAISVFRHPESEEPATTKGLVAIVCHGMFCDMTTCSLITSLSSFLSERWNVCRLDFSGNGKSSGEWSYALYQRDVADLDAVSEYLEKSLGLKTGLIVGHSKGGAAAILHGSAGRFARSCPHVSVAGRIKYDPKVCEKRFSLDEKEAMLRDGYITKTMYRRQWLITQSALDERRDLNGKIVQALQSLECPFFHIHGMADTTVCPEEADIVKKNAKGAVVEYVEGADHLYKGKECILAWKINKWIESILVTN